MIPQPNPQPWPGPCGQLINKKKVSQIVFDFSATISQQIDEPKYTGTASVNITFTRDDSWNCSNPYGSNPPSGTFYDCGTCCGAFDGIEAFASNVGSWSCTYDGTDTVTGTWDVYVTISSLDAGQYAIEIFMYVHGGGVGCLGSPSAFVRDIPADELLGSHNLTGSLDPLTYEFDLTLS